MESAGTQVTVDGIPAPILYAQDSQVNFVVPWSAGTKGLLVVCVLREGESGCVDATGDVSEPAAFGIWDDAAKTFKEIVLNQDFSLNSPGNPVRRGGFITLYLTGTGVLEGTLVDGAVSGPSLQGIVADVRATISGERSPPGCTGIGGGPCSIAQLPMQVAYAGSAPGLVAGVTQINLRIPDTVPLGAQRIELRFSRTAGEQRVVATVSVGP
jgi:uncharacterized protein (TIGR03437 family)